MKANELRIGNLLRDKISKTELKVIGLAEENISTYVIDRDKFPLKNGWRIEPIPLTEEWLLKFDFEITNNFQTKDRFQTHIQDGVIWFEYGYIVIELKYVHQLQNLYFALTGEELTITE